MQIHKSTFGVTHSGQEVSLFKLQNQNGLEVWIINYGAVIQSILLPDQKGHKTDVVLGYDQIEDYEDNPAHIGCIVGRCANRMHKGQFTIDGTPYQVTQNVGEDHLHGGIAGLHRRLWDVVDYGSDPQQAYLKLSYLSPDGEEGYPGNVQFQLTFSLNEANALSFFYHAITDQATPINLTHHDYFNLKDGGASAILDHQLQIYSDAYTPTDEHWIPTGVIASLSEDITDLRIAKTLAEHLGEKPDPHGFNLNICLHEDQSLQLAARLSDPASGRSMEVLTTQPALQLYTAASLESTTIGKNNLAYGPSRGICLETQHYPDAPNHPEFPSTVLHPGEVYEEQTVLRFGFI